MPVRSGLVQIHDDLIPLLVDIDTVHPHPSNYNNGDVDAISESIEVSGMYRPIYVQKSSDNIIAGNHTWVACKQLGAAQIPVVSLDVDDATALRIMVADNRTASLAKPDNGLLLGILDQLAEQDSLLGTGYGATDLDALRALASIPPNFDDFAQWPTLCFQVPPQTRDAFMRMTEVAVGDRERFEMVLRLAGWDGKKH